MKTRFVLLLISSVILIGSTNLFAAQARQWYPVKWVADGDTIFLEDGRRIRFIGINAPEVAHKDSPAEPYGDIAKRTLTKLLKHSEVRLEWDHVHSDRYGRRLAHVFDRENRLLSRFMVAEGLAHVLYQQDNQRYFDVFLKSQQNAMAKKKGLWRTFQSKTAYGHFWGNRRSLRFHAPNCAEAKKISRRNRVNITDARSAFEQGFAPAKGCLKGIGTFTK